MASEGEEGVDVSEGTEEIEGSAGAGATETGSTSAEASTFAPLDGASADESVDASGGIVGGEVTTLADSVATVDSTGTGAGTV